MPMSPAVGNTNGQCRDGLFLRAKACTVRVAAFFATSVVFFVSLANLGLFFLTLAVRFYFILAHGICSRPPM